MITYIPLHATMAAIHTQHVRDRMAWNDCPLCNADRERRFARNVPFHYAHVHEYLEWVRPRLQAIRAGKSSVDARVWLRDFRKAMNRRITSHATGQGRKWNDSYLERLGQFGHCTDVKYLRRFAQRGASCLDA